MSESNHICFEVFPGKHSLFWMRRVLVDRHEFKEKENKIGPYFVKEVPMIDAWHVRAVLKAHNYKFREFNSRYERSSNYRSEFFEHNRGPHRCAYCGRFVSSKNLEVDHLIPVAKAKNSTNVRFVLQMCGIKNVNDWKNLVASCKKCNRSKSDKMGFWVVKGFFGRHKSFWYVRDIVVVAIAIAIINLVLSNGAELLGFIQNLSA